MTRSVIVYGFGSAFAETGTANTTAEDVDLLIIHPGTDAESCQFAISCKRRLADIIARAHTTMLSDGEEQHCQFIKTSRAVCLGSIREGQIECDLQAIYKALPSLEKP